MTRTPGPKGRRLRSLRAILKTLKCAREEVFPGPSGDSPPTGPRDGAVAARPALLIAGGLAAGPAGGSGSGSVAPHFGLNPASDAGCSGSDARSDLPHHPIARPTITTQTETPQSQSSQQQQPHSFSPQQPPTMPSLAQLHHRYQNGIPCPADFNFATHVVDKWALHQPPLLALHWISADFAKERKLTYAELAALSERAAVGLSRLGIKKGDRVLVSRSWKVLARNVVGH